MVWISPAIGNVFGCDGATAPVLGISPAIVIGFGVDGAVAPVLGISPARATPESTHARAIANAKRLILSVSPLRSEDASVLARKQSSVNTYRAIDTALRAVRNIGRCKVRLLTLTETKVYLCEDGLT